MLEAQTLTAINITIDIFAFCVVAIILLSLFLHKSKRIKKNIWLMLTIIADLVCSFADIFTWLCNGSDNPYYVFIHPIAVFAYYIAGYGITYFFCLFLFEYVGGYILTKKYRIFISVLAVIYGILLFITPFTDLFYVIDENNVYSRGPLVGIPVVLQILTYLSIIIFLIKYRSIISFRKIYSHIVFLVVPQAMQIIQITNYGISLMTAGFAIAFIFIFLDMNLNLEKVLDKSFEVLRQRDAKLIQMQNQTILSLSSIVEERDTDTGGHVQRTSNYSELLASQLMKAGMFIDIIDEKYIANLSKAAPMHDIGKIVVPDAVLKKPGRLTPEEFEEMKRHALEGGRIIREVLIGYDDKEYVKMAIDIATYHHEKWDGTGYPKGLAGSQIPLSARIMALADVFDALVSPRVYKEPMSYDQAFALIQKESGTHFDPVLAKTFLDNKEKMIAINEHHLEIQSSLLDENTDNDIELLETLEEV